jgi:hypothetical protein
LEKEKRRERHPERRREGGNYISRIFDETSLAQIGDDLQNCFCAFAK